MPYILNIETSTTLCSVALSKNGEVISLREKDDGYTHSENLHVFIDEVLKESGISPIQLNAIAVGSGPGSFTGLRIGVTSAKGMCYALKIPLIAVNTLMVMAKCALGVNNTFDIYTAMIDARRMEVYCSSHDNNLNEVKETSAEVISIENLDYFKAKESVCFFGDGMPKCREILGQIENSHFIENIKPFASPLAQLSIDKFRKNQFEDVANFEPFYLKDFFVKK